MIKPKLPLVLLVLFFFQISLPPTANAVTLPGGIEIVGPTGDPELCQNGDGLFCNGEDLTLAKIISTSIPFIFSIAGLVLFALLLYGGFKFLTSMGDEQEVEKAKGLLTDAVVGFIVIFTAYWLTLLLGRLFGVEIF